jgi:hypothetical protein
MNNRPNRQKNIAKSRFFACASDTRLLHILQRAAVRPTIGGVVSRFQFSAGEHSNCAVTRGSIKKRHLLRCGIFRGKVSQRQNQKQKPPLD